MREKTSKITLWMKLALLAALMFGLAAPHAAALSAASNRPVAYQQTDPKLEAGLIKQVHHALAMNPWYGVFDDLAYSVNGTEVTLTGEVVYPGTKEDAVASVKHIEGVTHVIDKITVLPFSSMDFQIRRAEYRAIFSYASLYRYAMGVNPMIHIIVDTGHVTLIGYVDNETDARLAYLRANSVPGVFSVTNDLKVG
ncbi:MAG TPA: BON domain-containing protein [Candidatus Acidoferrales bacterium]|nr:BON domain-containing protein [Candidatus Acidoferrales bacterium]